MDEFEATHPQIVVSRVRPGLVLQHDAASEIARLFLGAHFPKRWLGRVRLPVLPVPVQVMSQAVHADDLADAFARIINQRAGGAFNIAGEPVLDPAALGEVVGARKVIPLRLAVLRSIMWCAAGFHRRTHSASKGGARCSQPCSCSDCSLRRRSCRP